MSAWPGQQDISTFLGGGFNNPQILSSQIPGGQTLPQLFNPQNYQPQTQNSPQSNPFNSALLNAIQSGTQNSGANHTVSSGGYQNNPAIPAASAPGSVMPTSAPGGSTTPTPMGGGMAGGMSGASPIPPGTPSNNADILSALQQSGQMPTSVTQSPANQQRYQNYYSKAGFGG